MIPAGRSSRCQATAPPCTGAVQSQGNARALRSLDPMTAIKEAAQGFARKFEPCVLCTYEIDCEDVVDLRREQDASRQASAREDMACPWFAEAAAGREPASWRLARRLIASGAAGLIAPSFVRGAVAGGRQPHSLGLERPPAPQGRGLRPERPAAEKPALACLWSAP